MIRGPTDQNRVVVLGRTGSGKSQFAIALLSTRNWTEMPWVIIDYKGEELLKEILEKSKGALKVLKVTDKPPKVPGLYYMSPKPIVDDEAVNAFLWKMYAQEDIGLFVDEGFALPQKRGSPFDILLTQGRSKHIPVIVLYQRPVWMSRFAIAQADFFAVFEQNDMRDLEITCSFVGEKGQSKREVMTQLNSLPRYHCLWYDVGEGVASILRPAPTRDEIINAFLYRLNPRLQKVLI